MPEWNCIAGSTLLIPTGNERHIFIILNNPENFDGHIPNSCIAVNASTIKNDIYDSTCVLKAGCHPFITHNSYIAYRYARIETASHFEKHAKTCLYIPQDQIKDELLSTIIKGLKDSPHTPRYIKPLI